MFSRACIWPSTDEHLTLLHTLPDQGPDHHVSGRVSNSSHSSNELAIQ